MKNNKLQNIKSAMRRLPLEMALHPFVTFLAGFVVAMAVAAAITVYFFGSIGSGQPLDQNEVRQLQKFQARNCLKVFATWDKQKAAAQIFSQNDFKDPFATSATSTVDQIQE